jgi:hypothetical protein
MDFKFIKLKDKTMKKMIPYLLAIPKEIQIAALKYYLEQCNQLYGIAFL